MAWSEENRSINITTPLGKDVLILKGFEGTEYISKPFFYRLQMFSSNKEIDLSQVVGKSVTVNIYSNGDNTRYINGIVGRFTLVQGDPLSEVAMYEAEIHPWLWMLTFRADCRIFQAKTAVEIIEKVFSDAGYTDYKSSLTKTYPQREYCVQYRETDFNFVSRLMEEEGIFYFFEQADGSHTLVMGDDPSAHSDCPTTSTITYRANVVQRQIEEDIVSICKLEQAVVSSGYGLNDYNFTTPSTSLHVTSNGTGNGGTIEDYPGNHGDTGGGERLSQEHLESVEAMKTVMTVSGRCRSLIAGYKVTLQSHPRSDFNTSYVMVSLHIKATLEDYVATAHCIPSTVPFSPPMETRRPIIPSTQTALVVGKAGEEIWVDSYGRIKVQFYWDRVGQKDENSSCWIRVAQGWAGKTWGIMFIPRIGQEVVVSFLEGNPDRPLITGAVYNAEQTVPYALPGNQTKSTIKSQSSKNGQGKFNEFRFEDNIGSEEIYIHAQKDENLVVENDVTRTIKHNETTTITNDCTLTINHDNTITVKNNRSRTVSDGNDSLTVSTGTRSVTVQGKETHTNHDAFDHTVDSNYTLTVKGNLTISVTGDLKITAKSITMESSSAGVTVKAATSMLSQSGTSLDIKSGTAMKLTAGVGLDLKATAALNAEGLTATVKGSTTSEVSGGAMLTLKGGIVKIN